MFPFFQGDHFVFSLPAEGVMLFVISETMEILECLSPEVSGQADRCMLSCICCSEYLQN